MNVNQDWVPVLTILGLGVVAFIAILTLILISNVILFIASYIVDSFIREVPEDEIWVISNNWGRKQNKTLFPGRYLMAWRLFTVEWTYSNPIYNSYTTVGSTKDGITVKLTWIVSIQFLDTFNLGWIEPFAEIQNKITGISLQYLEKLTLLEILKSKELGLDETNRMSLNTLAKSYNLEIKDVQMSCELVLD